MKNLDGCIRSEDVLTPKVLERLNGSTSFYGELRVFIQNGKVIRTEILESMLADRE